MTHAPHGFVFPLGSHVGWAEHGGTWRVVWHRVTFREVLGPVIEYGVVQEGARRPSVQWVYEADCLALPLPSEQAPTQEGREP